MDIIIEDRKTERTRITNVEKLYNIIKSEIEKYTYSFDVDEASYAMDALVNWQPILAWIPFITYIAIYRDGTDTRKWVTEFKFSNSRAIKTTTYLERKLYEEFFVNV